MRFPILLLGSSGYVGSKFAETFRKRGILCHSVKLSEYNYLNPDKLYILLKGTKYKTVINCAGYTGKPNVDQCEKAKSLCLYSNATWAGLLAEYCNELDIDLGHVSSGCIYTSRWRRGDCDAYTEEDRPNFAFNTEVEGSWYSGTKALGELCVKEHPKHYIWRIRIPFDSDRTNPRNYLVKLLNYDTLLDATNSISHLGETVDACIDSLSACPYGTYNITNPHPVETHFVTELLKERFPQKTFKFFESLEEFDKTVKAPRSNCVLDSSKIMSHGIHLTDAYEKIRECIKDWK